MDFLWFLLLSILSGVLAGMGMGGGTLLIPMLTLIMGVDHIGAQAINLIVFVPCAIVVCIIYMKNKLIDFKSSWLIVVFASAISVVASIVAVKIKSKVMSIIFGIFLIALGVVQVVVQIVNQVKNKKKDKVLATKSEQ